MGLATAVLCAFPAAKFLNIDVWETADLYAPSIAIGGFFVKLGCFFIGCCFGTPCPVDTPFAVTFPFNSGASQIYPDLPLYPAQLYESTAWLVTFILLILLYRNKPVFGRMIAAVFFIYGTFRFTIEFFRHNDSVQILSIGRLWCLLAILLAVFVWVKRKPV
ncbi:MAG: prolipoprotein diacylglyceryl transferase [Spirochaetia bacterium]|nr:prolipoprotein diacylglyceryl transferase [Spirochaetia bacterium]